MVRQTAASPVRIGMLTPSSNTCLEPVTEEVVLGAQIDVSTHFSRVPVARIALDSQADAQFGTQPVVAAARLLADAAVDLIVWNGTAGSWLGVEHDYVLISAIEQATGVRATTSTLALLDACRAFGVTRLGLALPYTADVAEQIAARYAEHDIHCARVESLGLTENLDFAATPGGHVRRLIERAGTADVQAVAVVCTNVFGAPHVVDVERKLGVPVFDSVLATLWQSLHLAGARSTVPGWGRLLETGTTRLGFQHVVEDLLTATFADRVTLRIDLPARALGVDLTAAEAIAPGVRPIRWDGSLNQRQLNTVLWLEEHRRTLVQPHFRADPSPPDALIDTYGVRAQMLGPVVRGTELIGWLSVHSLREREWRAADLVAVEEATRRVDGLLN